MLSRWATGYGEFAVNFLNLEIVTGTVDRGVGKTDLVKDWKHETKWRCFSGLLPTLSITERGR